MLGFWGLIYREVRLYTRSKLNVALSLSTPLAYSLLFSGSLAGTVSHVYFRDELLSYPEFVTPGLVVLTTLLGAMMCSQSVYQERDSGMLLEILSCPLHPNAYIAGKLFGTACISSLQGVLLLVTTTVFFRLDAEPAALLRVAALIPVFSLMFNAVYLCVCGLVRDVQAFVLSVNLITMVLMFTGSVFYPVASVPAWLRWFTMVNPVTLACETCRAAFLGLSLSGNLPILIGAMSTATAGAAAILRKNILCS